MFKRMECVLRSLALTIKNDGSIPRNVTFFQNKTLYLLEDVDIYDCSNSIDPNYVAVTG